MDTLVSQIDSIQAMQICNDGEGGREAADVSESAKHITCTKSRT